MAAGDLCYRAGNPDAMAYKWWGPGAGAPIFKASPPTVNVDASYYDYSVYSHRGTWRQAQVCIYWAQDDSIAFGWGHSDPASPLYFTDWWVPGTPDKPGTAPTRVNTVAGECLAGPWQWQGYRGNAYHPDDWDSWSQYVSWPWAYWDFRARVSPSWSSQHLRAPYTLAIHVHVHAYDSTYMDRDRARAVTVDACGLSCEIDAGAPSERGATRSDPCALLTLDGDGHAISLGPPE